MREGVHRGTDAKYCPLRWPLVLGLVWGGPCLTCLLQGHLLPHEVLHGPLGLRGPPEALHGRLHQAWVQGQQNTRAGCIHGAMGHKQGTWGHVRLHSLVDFTQLAILANTPAAHRHVGDLQTGSDRKGPGWRMNITCGVRTGCFSPTQNSGTPGGDTAALE